MSNGDKSSLRKGRSASAEPHETPELERKLVFVSEEAALALSDSVRTLRDGYRHVFEAIAADREHYPDLSYLFHLKAGEAMYAPSQEAELPPRARESKDARRRVYLADAKFKLVDAGWEIRLEPLSRRLMIKHTNAAANENHPTMDRTETKHGMRLPRIGRLGDVQTNGVKKDKKPPKALREVFGKSWKSVDLYPVVETCSVRSKLTYFREALYKGEAFQIMFEFAQDEGQATALGGDQYDLDQFELEVKQVIHVRTGTDVLDDRAEVPELGWEELRDNIIEPALSTEVQALSAEYGLKTIYHSKPAEGFEHAKTHMSSAQGMGDAAAARERHLDTSVWSELYMPQMQPV